MDIKARFNNLIKTCPECGADPYWGECDTCLGFGWIWKGTTKRERIYDAEEEK